MLKCFAEKNVSSFCNAKATHIFSAKNIRILCIESAKTVNEMTLNELLKLTTLWTTGPRSPDFISHQLDCNSCCKRMWDRKVFPKAPYSPDFVYSDYYPGANSEWVQVFAPPLTQIFIFMDSFWYTGYISNTVFTLKIHTLCSLPYTSLQQVRFTIWECITKTCLYILTPLNPTFI